MNLYDPYEEDNLNQVERDLRDLIYYAKEQERESYEDRGMKKPKG